MKRLAARFIFVTVLMASFLGIAAGPVFSSEKTYREAYQKQANEWQEFKVGLAKEALTFQKKLKEVAGVKRAEAVFQFEQEQYKLEKAYREKMHGVRMSVLKLELEEDPAMSEAKRRAVLDFQEKAYQNKAAFYEALNQESIKLYQDVTRDPVLLQEVKNEALKKLNNGQAEKRKKFAVEQDSARKEFQEKIRLL